MTKEEKKNIKEDVFEFIANNPECDMGQILKEIVEDRQLVRYHIDCLIAEGLVVKVKIHNSVVYYCSFDEDEIKEILPDFDKPIKKLLSKVSGLKNPKEAVKQIIAAYIEII